MQEFNERVTDLLVNSLLYSKFLEFCPSVIAMSALQHISKDSVSSTKDERDSVCMAQHFTSLITPPDQQEKLIKCYEMMMEETLWGKIYNTISCNPSSPVTVLASIDAQCCSVDFRHCCQASATDDGSYNLLKMMKNKEESSSCFTAGSTKRKREENESKI